MKKSIFLLSLLAAGVILVGHTAPRSYSDLATYQHIPTKTRVDNLMKAGEDLYLRRRYEDAKSVFEMVLQINEGYTDAEMWVSKCKFKIEDELNEAKKKELFRKYGYLTPIDKIYENWHWGPEVGHFEVRYSEPKPYVPKVRKFRPKATDAEVTEALNAYKKDKTAENAFELAMRYWSQRKKSDAIKYYLEAASLDPEILSKDDEYMLSMNTEELEEKISSNKAGAEDYLTFGRLALLQGNKDDGLRSMIKSVMLDKNLKKRAEEAIGDYVASPLADALATPPEVYSFRQAYVYDKDSDRIYLRVILCPRDKSLLVPIDTTVMASNTANVSIESKDVLFAYNKNGIGASTRLWVALPEKAGDFPEYEVRLVINLKREGEGVEEAGVDLSNYSLTKEQPDNWSMVIASEFNNTEGMIPGNYETIENGVRVTGYHLGTTEGKGPYIDFTKYTEPLPQNTNIWKIIENKEDEMNLL